MCVLLLFFSHCLEYFHFGFDAVIVLVALCAYTFFESSLFTLVRIHTTSSQLAVFLFRFFSPPPFPAVSLTSTQTHTHVQTRQ